MRLALTFLGWDLFTVEVTRGVVILAEDPGDALSVGYGFAPAYDDRSDDAMPEDR